MRANAFNILIVVSLPLIIFSLNHYIISDITYSSDRTSLTANLHFKDPSSFNISKYNITPLKNETSIHLITSLSLSISLECDSFLHFIIKDKNKQRFEPNITDNNYLNEIEKCSKNLNLDDIGLFISDNDAPFKLELRNYNNAPYYALNKNNFLFSDTLIVFDASLTTDLLFGFGERNTNFKLGPGRYTIWPNDTTHTYRDGKEGGYNLMGHQPIGLHKTKDDMFLGFVFMNTNAQDLVIKPITNSALYNTNLEHRTIGGIIDYYITFGHKADDAILNIHKIIGRPIIPPFWTFGWHQCKWGYTRTNDIKLVYNKYKEYKLPIDTFWGDTDILFKKRNFQYNNMTFKDLPIFIEELHRDNRKFIPIIDYGIPMEMNDPYFKLGKEKKAFILSNFTQSELINHVWPGKCVFPDVFTQNGVDLWNQGLKDFDKAINYDGIWIDMNEPGMLEILPGLRGEILPISYKYNDSRNKYEYIPYIPGYRRGHFDLQSKGISLNGYSHKNNPENDFYTMYNIRPLISLYQVKITHDYLVSSNRRPFILSRANTIGHGKYAFHWLGDNASEKEDLKDSIAGIFNYNIYGVPMTGADICGFHKKATDTLCARWHVLGAFYPFSRNHNEIFMNSQEPWAFIPHNKNTSFTLEAAKKAITMKYSIIRYYYTQMMLISLGKKGSCFKPLFFEFPKDDKVYTADIMDTHIMIGDALLFIPNLSETTEAYTGYFPNANWNTFPQGEFMITYNPLKGNKGITTKLNGDYDKINVFLRGGKIIPYQNATHGIQTTNDLRNNKIDLIINPDHNLHAEGDFICDNDEVEVIKSGKYNHIKINYNSGYLSFSIEKISPERYQYQDIFIGKIIFYRGKEIISELFGNINESEVLFRNGQINAFKISFAEEEDKIIIDFNDSNASIFDIQLINL